MAKKDVPATASPLEIATNVLVRMEGHGLDSARRLLARCTGDEVQKIAECHCEDSCCDRVVGDKFRTTFGEVMDGIFQRQEAAQDQADELPPHPEA
jgi:hypothetical protein